MLTELLKERQKRVTLVQDELEEILKEIQSSYCIENVHGGRD